MYYHNGSQMGPNTANTVTNTIIYKIVVDGSNSSITENNNTVYSGTLSATTLNGFNLGVRGNISEYGDVDIGEVLLYDHVLNTDDQIKVGYYLGDKFGITMPAPTGTQYANIQEWRDSNGNTLAAMNVNGRMGIGSSSPTSKLSITGTAGVPVFTFASSTNSVLMMMDASGKVGVGTTSLVSTMTVQGSLCVVSTGTCGSGAGEIYTTGGNVVSIDLAENYPVVDETIQAGDIVAISDQTLSYEHPSDPRKTETIGTLIKAQKGTRLLGAISTKPGMLFGYDIKEVPVRPVALSGRIPVKVSASAGEIRLEIILPLEIFQVLE